MIVKLSVYLEEGEEVTKEQLESLAEDFKSGLGYDEDYKGVDSTVCENCMEVEFICSYETLAGNPLSPVVDCPENDPYNLIAGGFCNEHEGKENVCSECGELINEDEAVFLDGKFYCEGCESGIEDELPDDPYSLRGKSING